jgi:hypothetical protein
VGTCCPVALRLPAATVLRSTAGTVYSTCFHRAPQVLSLLHTLTGDFDAAYVSVAIPVCLHLLEDDPSLSLRDLSQAHVTAVAAMQLATDRLRTVAALPSLADLVGRRVPWAITQSTSYIA